MIFAQNYNPSGLLDADAIYQTLYDGLESRFTDQKLLVLIPDHTRSLPLPALFKALVQILRNTQQLDFMVALGTHPALSEAQLYELVGISQGERDSTYHHVGLFNHAWDKPEMLVSLGTMEQDEIKALAGEAWHESLPNQVDININKMVLEYDHILVVGPTFPHEVVGFSGGAKYFFPGISGPEMINATHWLGALSGVVNTIGIKDTPVRAMLNAAMERLHAPVTLMALTVLGKDLAGIFIGDIYDAWNQAVEASSKQHIQWVKAPFQRVLSCAPAMYDELWTAAKAAYKLEPALQMGGETIIYAPHLDTVSHVHGKYIYQTGYHILEYFLANWEQYRHFPLAILAHSSHVRGSGMMQDGIEKANIRVTLASKIPAQDCAKLNLGYLDPLSVNIDDWKNREEEGVLLVPRAGEILYKVRK